jgi:hypothetical protein
MIGMISRTTNVCGDQLHSDYIFKTDQKIHRNSLPICGLLKRQNKTNDFIDKRLPRTFSVYDSRQFYFQFGTICLQNKFIKLLLHKFDNL